MAKEGYSVWVELLFQGEITVQAESMSDAEAQVRDMLKEEHPRGLWRKIDAHGNTRNPWMDHEAHVTGILSERTRMNQ